MSDTLDRTARFGRILNQTRLAAGSLFRAEKTPEGRSLEFTHQVMKHWADALLGALHVQVHCKGTPTREPSLFVGNHMSYLDIPLLMSQTPVVFIAKKELASWPFFGHGMRSVGTVFVDRGSVHSRKDAADTIAPYIRQSKQSVAIFPSGTTKVKEDKEWRWGAFLIAKRNGIPIQPFRLRYEPARTVAFIDEDAFPPHLWRLLGTAHIQAHIEFHPPVKVGDPQEEARRWWLWAREYVDPTAPPPPPLRKSQAESRVDG